MYWLLLHFVRLGNWLLKQLWRLTRALGRRMWGVVPNFAALRQILNIFFVRLGLALVFLFAGFNMSGYDLWRLCRRLVGQARVVEVYQDPSALTAIVIFLVWVGIAGWALNQSRLALKSGIAWVGAIIGLSIVILFNLKHIPVRVVWVVSFVEVGLAVVVAFAFTFPKIR